MDSAREARVMRLAIVVNQFPTESSGVANTYRDAIRLLKGPKKIMSCRGVDEQIAPLVKERRAARLRELVELMDSVHCVPRTCLRP